LSFQVAELGDKIHLTACDLKTGIPMAELRETTVPKVHTHTKLREED